MRDRRHDVNGVDDVNGVRAYAFARWLLGRGDVGASVTFGRILTLERLPTEIAQFILSITENKLLILLCINVLLLLVGTFMETLAAIVILTPILLPITSALGMDPVHFGIVMIVNLAIGFVTPPLGANLFMNIV